MTAITAYPIVRTYAGSRGTASSHAVEKVSPAAGIDGESTSRHPAQTWVCTTKTKRAPSHSDTDQTDPYWDAPRLTPTFVAQVMGQVYCTNAPLPSAGAAYRAAPSPRPVLFDENV